MPSLQFEITLKEKYLRGKIRQTFEIENQRHQKGGRGIFYMVNGILLLRAAL